MANCCRVWRISCGGGISGVSLTYVAPPEGAQVRYSDGSVEAWTERVGGLGVAPHARVGAAVRSGGDPGHREHREHGHRHGEGTQQDDAGAPRLVVRRAMGEDRDRGASRLTRPGRLQTPPIDWPNSAS